MAVAEQEAKTAKRRRVKQKAIQRKPAPAPDSDSDLPDPKRRSQSGGKDAGAGGKGRDSGCNGLASGGKGSVSKGTRQRDEVDLVLDDDVREQKESSRHTTVAVSQIYKDWQGSLLDDVRSCFQALMFARDGYPLKNLASYKKLNFKLALRAAQAIMSSKDYASFNGQMEQSFRDIERS